MCGLYAPTDGEMLIDGLDSRQYPPAPAARQPSASSARTPSCSRGTVRDNLMLGAARADDQQLIDAVVRSGADIFLSRDAAGFDLPVGERGSRLSGGQRSLLVLARALVQPVEAAVPRRADRRDGHADRALFHRASEDGAGARPDAGRVDPSPQHAVDRRPADRHRRRAGSSPTARATKCSGSLAKRGARRKPRNDRSPIVRSHVGADRRRWRSAALLGAVVGGADAAGRAPTRASAATAALIAPAQAAALIAATSGEQPIEVTRDRRARPS